MQQSSRAQLLLRNQRNGFTTPLVAAALLVAMLGLALILDRLWLEAARLELITAAEASALAGARQLASDQRLLVDQDPRNLVDQAVQSAMMAAIENRVAGQPVAVGEGDIAFPSPTFDPAGDDEDNVAAPESIIVTAHRTRFRGNPVALFIGELTGQPFGDAVGQAGASILGNVVGVRPLPDTVAPALPLAIWLSDPTGQRVDTWHVSIEQRRGRDDFGYDEHTRSVTTGADGIPELTLRTARAGGPASEANVQLLDIGTQFQDKQLLRQFQQGWTAGDLESWGGELRVATSSSSSSLSLDGLPTLEPADSDALDQILGEPRIALLYSAAAPGNNLPVQTVDCVRLVALRVLQVSHQGDGSCRMTIQPTVIATRSAIVGPTPIEGPSDNNTPGTASQAQYIYRLQLTK
ncbi:MAG: hypothetical protein B7Z55_04175 [Planctomycetales bacterium 12-60-4]|nr:MAG: hypothetical protein B7Z55_04175 [Planctomycetales bacterium 12-60-4]